MNNLTDRDLLSIWEKGLNKSLIEKSLLLLACAYPNFDHNEIAFFSIGDRDSRLLHIRENLFGPILQNATNCPECGQKIEWETPIDTIKLQPLNEEKDKKPIDLIFNEYQISFRLPNSVDVMEILASDKIDSITNQLISKCIIKSTLTSQIIEDFPEDLINTIIRKMEENDPQADIVMKILCPECEHEWNITFDIMQYLWIEINERAIKLIQDIYLLASNFGWSENDILDMDRFRRNLYINMINA
jgi:hypothetical protein